MANSTENGRDYANGGSYRQQENYYTQEDAVIVDKAKTTHRETTQSAQRALKVVLVQDEDRARSLLHQPSDLNAVL